MVPTDRDAVHGPVGVPPMHALAVLAPAPAVALLVVLDDPVPAGVGGALVLLALACPGRALLYVPVDARDGVGVVELALLILETRHALALEQDKALHAGDAGLGSRLVAHEAPALTPCQVAGAWRAVVLGGGDDFDVGAGIVDGVDVEAILADVSVRCGGDGSASETIEKVKGPQFHHEAGIVDDRLVVDKVHDVVGGYIA